MHPGWLVATEITETKAITEGRGADSVSSSSLGARRVPPHLPMNPGRRQFLQSASLASVGLVLGARPARAAVPRRLFSGLGVTAALDRAAEVKAAGADYLVESVGRFLMPERPDADFAPMLERAQAAPLPLVGCNGFLRDPKLRCTGPDADHPRVLDFAAVAFRRLKQAGGEFIVFGSAGSRRIPEGFPKEKADEQFIALLSRMGPLAVEAGVSVFVEQLQQRECNYLMHLREVAHVVAQTNHPNIRALADIYHMTNMGDTPADLERALPWVALMEIAEKEQRTAPGVVGEDFRPFFAVLAKGGYQGRITIEGRWNAEQLKNAFAEIGKQSAEAMGGRG